MSADLPVYVEEEAERYVVRPLFRPAPVEGDADLSRALRRLSLALRRDLADLGRLQRHDRLAGALYAPPHEERLLKLDLPLKRRRLRGRFLFVVLRAGGRRVAFTPSWPDLWLTLERGADLRARAAEVLTAHYRGLEHKGEDLGVRAGDRVGVAGRAFVLPLEVEAPLGQRLTERPKHLLASLFERREVDGRRELARVGRCLDWLHPDELERALFRDAEAAELERALAAPDRRPVLVLGPRGAGKTALVHEVVARRVLARGAKRATRDLTWLLAPQRLISGMSHVGQWEERLLAILTEARRRGHVLFFDDLLGLFEAGTHSRSDLSVAHVLKPRLERREVRVLAETTPEALRVLRERDRGLADLFHVVRVGEPDERTTLRVLIGLARRLEAETSCRFDLDVLPAVHELMGSFVRDVAFPGKAASFLARLAAKRRGLAVTRPMVLDELHAQTGLSLSVLDRRAKLERQDVVTRLRQELVGQEAAVEAVADVVCTAKARLNDPARPLGCFLLLGPTGVGKTWCAKTVASYLFGSDERLLRLDMNELSAPGAAARLVGTWGEPDGLLTAALRRQPFSVVLLDEVEKAHPEVFDLLLQVLGEGRLTDARGRTADFSSALVLMTSNLGVREAEANLGFGARPPEQADAVYVREAERFFRPELFNRIDRVIPFHRLAPADVGRIASRLVEDVLARDGLVRRKCALEVHEGALARVVAEGYDPKLGARALKRAVERQLTARAAARLAALEPAVPTLMSLYPGPDGLHVQALRLALPRPGAAGAALDAGAELPRLEQAIAEVERGLAALRPAGGAIDAATEDPQARRYFLLRELAREARQRTQAARDAREAEGETDRKVLLGAPARAAGRGHDGLGSPDPRALFAQDDLRAYLRELAQQAAPSGEVEARLTEARRAAALLRATARASLSSPPAGSLSSPPAGSLAPPSAGSLASPPAGSLAPERALVLLRWRGSGAWAALELHALLEAALRGIAGLDVARVLDGAGLTVEGPCALALARVEEGTHLFLDDDGPTLAPVQVAVRALAPGEDALATLARADADRRAWVEELAAGRAAPESDPWPLGEVLRVYDPLPAGPGSTLDCRTGTALQGPLDGPRLTGLLLDALAADLTRADEGHGARAGEAP